MDMVTKLERCTIIEVPSDPEPGSNWAFGCPFWAMIAVVGGRIKVLDSCGRYFDYESEDLVILEQDSWHSPEKIVDGIYICEGDFVSDRDWETGVEEGGWQPGEIRPITAAEWAQYCEEDSPWPPEFYAAPVVEPFEPQAPQPAACVVEDMDDCAVRCSD